jgi:tonB dependent/ligand-gated channel
MLFPRENSFSCLFKTIILVMCLLMITFSFSQEQGKGIISGKVLYKDETPVQSATVYIPKTNFFAYTDEKGAFTIKNIPLGKEYLVEIRVFDQSPLTTKVFAKEKINKIIVKLDKNEEISLSEVVVVRKGKGEEIKEKGYAMNVIKTQEASLKNIQTTELLGRSSGVKIRQSAGIGSEMTFNLNGLTGNSVRIFIDGIPIRNYGRSFSLSSIPPSMIDRIEVYKGVLPTEISEDALGGGINIVLKKNVSNSLITSYSYGSYNTHQWDLNTTFRQPELGLVANLSSYHNYTDNNYKVWGDNVYITDPETGRIKYVTAKRFHDRYGASGIKGNIGFVQKKWADDFSIGFMFSQMEKDIQTGATMNVVYGNRRTNSHSGLASLQYKKHHLFWKGLSLNTFTTYSLTYRNLIDDDPHIYNWLGQRVRNYLGEEQLNPQGGEASIATRAENTEENIANRTYLAYHFTKNQNVSASYFYNGFSRKIDDPLLPQESRDALDKRRYNKHILGLNYEANFFHKKLRTNLFYKFYHQNVSLTEVTTRIHPRLGYTTTTRKHEKGIDHQGYGAVLAYKISSKLILTSSAEKAIRLPSATELLGNTSEMVNANYTLNPERSTNFNIGMNIGDFHYKKHKISSEINFFVRDINDLITRGVPRETDDSFSFENLGKINSKGVDMDVHYSLGKSFFVHSNLSYNRAVFNLEYDKAGIRYFQYKNRLRNQPFFTSNTHIEYIKQGLFAKEDKCTFDYNFGYTHWFYLNWENLGSSNKTTIPAQPLHDIGVAYTFPNKRITLAFNIKNIFDTQVFDNFALQKPGRALYGKITYSIQ